MSEKFVMPVILGLAAILAVVALTARASDSTEASESYFCLTLTRYTVADYARLLDPAQHGAWRQAATEPDDVLRVMLVFLYPPEFVESAPALLARQAQRVRSAIVQAREGLVTADERDAAVSSYEQLHRARRSGTVC